MSAQNLAVYLHNQHRKVHDAPPLVLDRDLCSQAHGYAREVANGRKPKIHFDTELGKNTHRIEYGGSRCQHYSDLEAVTEAVETWYGYNSQYNWAAPVTSSFLAKLFCQVVWKSTERIGVGVATGGQEVRNLTVVVALYAPPGNSDTNYNYRKNVAHPIPIV